MSKNLIDVATGPGAWTASAPDLFEGPAVVVSTVAIGPGPVQSHEIRHAAADDPPCCRCGEAVAVGEDVHAVTTTGPDGAVTHRQVTHPRHLGGEGETVYLGGSRCGACGIETPPPERIPGVWRREVDATLVTESCAACSPGGQPTANEPR